MHSIQHSISAKTKSTVSEYSVEASARARLTSMGMVRKFPQLAKRATVASDQVGWTATATWDTWVLQVHYILNYLAMYTEHPLYALGSPQRVYREIFPSQREEY